MLFRMRIKRSATTLTALALLLTTALIAQQPSAPTPDAQSAKPVLHKAPEAEKTEAAPVPAKPVNLFAVVRDKKGQAVTTLAKDDFVLEQDGRPQAITQFVPETDQPIIIGILADTGPGQRNELSDERKAATDFVRQLREDKDKAFVLHFDHEVELLQDITASHDKLAKGVDQISVGDSAANASGRRRDAPDSDHPRYFFGGGMLYDAVFLSADEVLKGQKGRKAVIVFSDGVDHESKTNLDRAIEAAQRADMMVYTVYVNSEHDQQQGQQQGGYGRHGGGYPGSSPWPGGGGGRNPRQTQPEPKENKDANKKTLKRLADETGGRSFEVSKKETAAQIYAQIQDELKHQYGLVYMPDKPEAGYHKVKLSTKKPDMTVQVREGFYGD
jgi:VWFA-related protein